MASESDLDTVAALASPEASEPSRGQEVDGETPTLGTMETVGEALSRAKARERLFGNQSIVKLGRFTALGKLGAGGMGVVYAAYDDELDRKVAVKLLIESDDSTEQRLRQEARALAKLRHPNVVTVFEVGRHRGQLFVAMEFVDGQTLRDWSGTTSRSVREVVEVYRDAGLGLAAAHSAGLVHRDFKPDNVMLGTDGIVRVLDFGLARPIGSSLRRESSELDATVDDEVAGASSLVQSATVSNAAAGTPPYMPPEQWSGKDLGPAADQFAFCVSLWESLTGERPFVGDTIPALYRAIAAGEIRTSAQPIPSRLEGILRRGLSVRIEDRYPNIESLLAALHVDPALRRRRIAAVAAVAAVFVGLAGLGLAWAWSGDNTQACLEGERDMAQLWNPQAAASHAARFAKTELPYAEVSWRRVADGVDTWVDEWTAAYATHCRAHQAGARSDSGFDLQMRCLGRQRGELALLLSALEEFEASTVDKAPTALERLPSPRACEDPQQLRERDDALDPETRAKADSVEEELARAGFAQSLGRYPQALDIAGAAHEQAEEAGLTGLAAEATYARGSALDYLGQSEPAVAEMKSAFESALRNDQPELGSRAAAGLVWLHGEVLGRIDRAEDFAATAEALLDRIEDDEVRVANSVELWNALGSAMQSAGRYEEAQVVHTRALEAAHTRFGDRHLKVARSLTNLANVHWGTGQMKDAARLQDQALAIHHELQGPAHPTTLLVRSNRAVVAMEMGDLERAERLASEVATAQRDRLGPKHPSYANSLNTLGNIARYAGDYERSANLLEEAAQILLEADGPDSYQRLAPLENLARTYGKMGRTEEAIALLDEDRRVLVKLFGPETSHLDWEAQGRGLVLLDAGRVADAAEVLGTRLRNIRERQAEGEPSPPVALPMQVAYTSSLITLGRIADARKSHDRAAALLGDWVGGPDPEAEKNHRDNARLLAAAKKPIP